MRLALGLLLGLGIGYLLGFLQWQEPGRAMTARDQAGDRAPARRPPSNEAQGEQGPSASRQASGVSALLQVAASGADDDRVERVAPWTAQGRIRTADGVPIPGVEVLLLPSGLRQDVRSHERASRERATMPMEDLLTESARSTYLRRQETRRVFTDEQGAFRCEGLTLSGYGLQFHLEGYHFTHPDPRMFGGWSAQRGRVVEVVGAPRPRVQLIFREDGQVLTEGFTLGGRLQTENMHRGLSIAWDPAVETVDLDGFGRWSFGPGPDGPYAFDRVEIDLVPGDLRLHVLEIDVQPRRRLKIRCVDWPEDHLLHYYIHYAEDASKTLTVDDVVRSGRGATLTGAECPISALKPGTYAVVVRQDLLELCGEVHWVTIDRQDEELELSLPALPTNRVLEFDVRGPEGEPLKPGRVALWKDGRARRDLQLEQIIGPGHLRYVLPAQALEGDEATWSFQVEHLRFGTLVIDHPRGSRDPVSVRFEDTAELEILIQGDLLRHARLEATVQLRPLSEDARGRVIDRRVHQADPNMRVRQLRPGRYAVDLNYSPPDYWQRFKIPDVASVQVRAGANNRLELRLPPLGSLEVQGVQAVNKARLVVMKPGDLDPNSFRVSAIPDAAGVVRFDALPEGAYELTFTAALGQRQRVRVSGATVVQWRPVGPTGYEVRLSDASGRMARAGLRSGDQILSVRGVAILDGAREAQRERARLSGEGTLSVEVLRGRARLTLELPASMMNAEGTSAEARGGEVVPIF